MLWVDNQIGLLGSYVSALKEEGFDLVTADSYDDAIGHVNKTAFDVILVDLRLRPEGALPDGIDLLRQIHLVPIQGAARLGAFSGFLYLDLYRERLKLLGFPVQLVDKDFPPTDAPDFRARFLQPIMRFAEQGANHATSKNDRTCGLTGGEGADPFEIELEDFLGLPLDEKELMLDRAGELAADTIESAFARGAVWVLLCGSGEATAAEACTQSDIRSEMDIMEVARKVGCAPYQFFKPLSVEDGLMDCPLATRYPVVSLAFESGGAGPSAAHEANVTEVHFDTGCPISLLGYEQLLELGVVRPTQIFGKQWSRKKAPAGKDEGGEAQTWSEEWRSGFDQGYQAANLDLYATLQSPKATKKVRLRGRIVRRLTTKSPYTILCPFPGGNSGALSRPDMIQEDCPMHGDKTEPSGWPRAVGSDKKACPLRIGLVGRNLLNDNEGVSIQLDGRSTTVRLVPVDQDDGSDA